MHLHFLIALFAICFQSATGSKPVMVQINSKWKMFPFLTEVSEYFAEHSRQHYWPFLDEICNINLTDLKVCTQTEYQLALSVANRVAPHLLPALEMSLALHERMPKSEFFQKLARGMQVPIGFERTFGLASQFYTEWEDLEAKLDGNTVKTSASTWDRVYTPTGLGLENAKVEPSESVPHVYYYQDLLHPAFQVDHPKLVRLAQAGRIRYIFFPVAKNRCEAVAKLAGYGVGLNIKNMAYKTVDDQAVNLFSQEIPSVLSSYTPSKKSVEFVDNSQKNNDNMGVAFLTLLTKGTDKERFAKLGKIIREFPTYYNMLLERKPSNSEKREIYDYLRYNSWLNEYEDTTVAVNGQRLSDDFSPFQLIPLLSQELSHLYTMQELGFNASDSLAILTEGVSENAFAVHIDVRSSYILWLNDVEKDRTFANFPDDVTRIYDRLFYDTFYYIRRNLFNLVFFLNPSHPSILQYFDIMQRLLDSKVPIHFGVVITNAFDSDNGKILARIFSSMAKRSNVHNFLLYLARSLTEDRELDVSLLLTHYRQRYQKDAIQVELDDHPMDQFLVDSERHFETLGLGSAPVLVLNGRVIDSETLQNSAIYAIINEYNRAADEIREKLPKLTVTRETDMQNLLMGGENYYKRINHEVLSKKQTSVFPTRVVRADCEDDLRHSAELHYCLLKKGLFLSQPQPATQTFWLVLNLESSSGRRLLADFVSTGLFASARTGIIFSYIPESTNTLTFHMAQYLLVEETPSASQITALLEAQSFQHLQDEQTIQNALRLHWRFKSLFDVFDDGTYVLHTNRKYGPVTESNPFTGEDFRLAFDVCSHYFDVLADQKFTQMVEKVASSNSLFLTANDLTDVVTTLLSARLYENVRLPLEEAGSSKFVIRLNPKDNDQPFLRVHAVVFPMAEGSQKWVPILDTIQKMFNCELTIFLTGVDSPPDSASHKRYYQYLLEGRVRFSGEAIDPQFNVMIFDPLPHDVTLTLYAYTEQSWFIESMFANCDMDNVYLENTLHGCMGIFDLEYIMVEGHAYNIEKGRPASGLQFVLATLTENHVADTQVIHNLGYFQFKASAGLYFLHLKEGTSRDLNHIHRLTSITTGAIDVITVDSFQGQLIHVQVTDKAKTSAKKEKGSSAAEETSWWASFSEFFSQSKTKSSGESSNSEVINVFSLATGLLYERFMRIMVLSVLEHTKTPVKFWFLKNYVSPQFRHSIETLSQHWQFDYQFVQYQWPHWLRKQKDKQRIIWGYKILFLDVLFPLDVKRIIFVDADQIVRADLNELHVMDLGSSPYAYTPFCDDRKEMDRFRFWKTGYWRQHLAGRPYHISALYVVDLEKFRKLKAGDHLRGQYQSLSNDPNSLANLDQDLPNNIQSIVPIKSLPIEWLWCETWCSDRSKARAKTIDMCNNPLTHEAKLDRAKRIAPEWVQYDDAITRILTNQTTSVDTGAGGDL